MCFYYKWIIYEDYKIWRISILYLNVLKQTVEYFSTKMHLKMLLVKCAALYFEPQCINGISVYPIEYTYGLVVFFILVMSIFSRIYIICLPIFCNAILLHWQLGSLIAPVPTNWPGKVGQRITTQIVKFMGPTWGPSRSCWPQMGPMLAPWTLLSGLYQTTTKYNKA